MTHAFFNIARRWIHQARAITHFGPRFTMFADADPLLTVEQAAKLLGVKAHFIYEQTRQRAQVRHRKDAMPILPSIREGRSIRIRYSDLKAWMNLAALRVAA